MKCPRCGLYNPDSALRCDCGYSLESKAVEGSSAPHSSRRRTGCLTTYLAFFVLCYLFLLFPQAFAGLRNWDSFSTASRVGLIWTWSVWALSIVLLLAVLVRKLWGVYGYVALWVLAGLVSVVTSGLSFDLVLGLGMTVAQLLVFVVAVRRAWDLFNASPTSEMPLNRMRVPEQGAMKASASIVSFAKKHRYSLLGSVLGAVGSVLGVMPLGWVVSAPILFVFGSLDAVWAAGWMHVLLMVGLPFTLGPLAGLLAAAVGRALARRYPSTTFVTAIAGAHGAASGFIGGLLVGLVLAVSSSIFLCVAIPSEDAFTRGNANYEQGNLDQAIADYTKAIEQDPKNVSAYQNRALVYTRQGKWEPAIADYTKVMELDPNRATAYALRSYAYGRQGNLEQATADCTKASELDPTRANAYNFCGMAYAEQGNLDQALAAYAKAIELDPKAASTYNSRGLTYDRQGKLEQAIADYSKAIELDPKLARAYDNRSFAYTRQGKFEQAIADCTKAIELDPKRASAYNTCGVAYSELGNLQQAIAYHSEAIELAPGMPDAYSNRGTEYLAQGKLDQAIADFTRAIELSPDWAIPYMQRGVAYRQQGFSSKALADFETCLKLDLDTRDRSRVVQWMVEIK